MAILSSVEPIALDAIDGKALHEKTTSASTPSDGSEKIRAFDDDEEEVHVTNPEQRRILQELADKEELIPTEAFKANVDGDQSPFPEVAACVPNTDDPTIPCNTFRAWVLTTFWVLILAGVNQFFSMRYPSLAISYVVAQILVFPMGRLWERMPRWRVPLGKYSFDVNPGRFSIKEHALIAIVRGDVPVSTAYASGSLVAIISDEYWGLDYGAGFSFLYLLTSQSLGFGLAGLARRWLVYPAALIWPASLPSAVLFRALHEPQDRSAVNGWTVGRYRFFSYFSAFSFVLYWIPDYIWTSTSAFDFITWIAPHNQKVNTIFGMNSGLGLLPLSIDWTQITYAGQPLQTPFYITLPLLSSSTFDNTGKAYNITRVINSDLTLNVTKYEAYSPMYITMSYSLSYALSFAAVTAIVVHTYLYNGSEIWEKWKNAKSGGEDVHRRLMYAYKEVPDWWYGVLTIVVFGLGIMTIRYWDTGLPVWGFIVVCGGFGFFLIVPEGILEGTTNQRIFLNIITELVAGYAWPGKPIANMMVKCFGYNSVKHGMDFAQDLKLGQYMKIPPRPLFFGQIYATILATMAQTGVLRWMIGHIPNLCSPKNTDRFTCAGAKVVYSASMIWGSIGPQRMFQHGQVYSSIMYFFIIGPAVTVIVYIAYKRHPHSWIRYINVPIFFNAAGNIPPANTTQYSLWFIFGFIFNYLIRKRAFNWWQRYNYLLQAAMDTGTAIATIIIYFALDYHRTTFNWWGNTVGSNTDDANSVPWLKVAKGGHFGKGPGQF
ncbi:oligopeptide transporter [Grosmannia clavigera kw1407]|uniref:Oligopeptide transporter n=1 Tax=Grosmannia clavigera (strain kw1407 / UAMH 11150) TaxID=655863 RepID=F0XBK9_GROCL|nr:oligopeptide transporter [Grosmannia clavigera kw1407]EFX05091.1 oligopeptide transporter [Grosmannia clavigera kw1407]